MSAENSKPIFQSKGAKAVGGVLLAGHFKPRVAAGEIAIGEAQGGQRAAEALRVGLLDLEAGLERHAAQ